MPSGRKWTTYIIALLVVSLAASSSWLSHIVQSDHKLKKQLELTGRDSHRPRNRGLSSASDTVLDAESWIEIFSAEQHFWSDIIFHSFEDILKP